MTLRACRGAIWPTKLPRPGASTPAAQQVRVSQIIRTYRRRAKAWTDSYDTETDHSRNRQAQSRWDERIRDALQNGTPFAPA